MSFIKAQPKYEGDIMDIIKRVKKSKPISIKTKPISMETKAKGLAKQGLNTKEIAHELGISKYDASTMIKG